MGFLRFILYFPSKISVTKYIFSYSLAFLFSLKLFFAPTKKDRHSFLQQPSKILYMFFIYFSAISMLY